MRDERIVIINVLIFFAWILFAFIAIFNLSMFKTAYKSITWEEARLNCKKLGGHLVTITDSSEQEIVSELIGRQAYWIGAIGGGEHSSFQWITDETFDYTNWADGEPNNVATKENAVMLYPDGSWNDIEKDKTEIAYKNAGKVNMHYICEWDHKYNIIFGRNNSTFSFGF